MKAGLTFAAAILVLGVGCSPVVCGAGTRLEGQQCVASVTENPDASQPVDAGQPGDAGVELPITAIIKPIAVLQGFAACPNVTVGFRDGRSATLVLDPRYDVPIENVVRIDRAGFSLEWSSTDGRVRSASLPNCEGAVVGLTAGTSTVSLIVKDGLGRSQTIGNATVQILGFMGGAVRATRLVSPYTFPSAAETMLGSGERRRVVVDIEPVLPPQVPANTGLLPLPSSLSLESSDPSVVKVEANEVLAQAAGTATLTARYQVAGQQMASATTPFTVSASQAVRSIVFDLPRDDLGLVLPEASRLLEVLPEGACFNTTVYGVVEETQGRFLRTLDSVASVTASGALQAAGTKRFCASTAGEGKVQACHSGTCGVLATVVTNATGSPSLQATLTPNDFALGGFGQQRLCAELRVMATWGTQAARDVSTSDALRFATPFRTFVANPLRAVIDPASGLPLRRQGNVCFDVDVVAGQPDTAIRIFYAGGQTEVTAKVHF